MVLKDTKPLTDFARTNPAPTVELPYSNVNKRQIYVYTGENTDLTFTGKDDTAVKKLIPTWTRGCYLG